MDYNYHSEIISLQLTQSEVNSGGGAKKVSQHITGVMTAQAARGYEFHNQVTLPTKINLGCLGALFGVKAETVILPVLVFRKPI